MLVSNCGRIRPIPRKFCFTANACHCVMTATRPSGLRLSAPPPSHESRSALPSVKPAWKYSSRSVTIGMPESLRPNMHVVGLQLKDFIKEYVVPGAKPLTVTIWVPTERRLRSRSSLSRARTTTSSCSSIAGAAGLQLDALTTRGRTNPFLWSTPRNVPHLEGLLPATRLTQSLRCYWPLGTRGQQAEILPTPYSLTSVLAPQ